MFWKLFKKKPKFKATQITKENYNDLVANSDVPVLLDFYADHCGPCKVIGPIIDELAEEYQGRALVAKLNTESQPEIGAHFQIKSIPTLIFINKGQVTERYMGLVPKPNLEEILDEHIAGNVGS